jgi:hypothetical protein
MFLEGDGVGVGDGFGVGDGVEVGDGVGVGVGVPDIAPVLEMVILAVYAEYAEVRISKSKVESKMMLTIFGWA